MQPEEVSIIRIALAAMMGVQMLAWGWFSKKGGELTDKQFILFFTAGMLTGQVGVIIECAMLGAWATSATQVYYFIFTVWGGYKRFRKMRTVK